MHAVLALPSRATLGCSIPSVVKRLFPLEQELGIMLHWESTDLAVGGLQFIKQVRRGSLEGGDWLRAPGVDWICAIPPASLGHPGTINAWASAVSQERFPAISFSP